MMTDGEVGWGLLVFGMLFVMMWLGARWPRRFRGFAVLLWGDDPAQDKPEPNDEL